MRRLIIATLFYLSNTLLGSTIVVSNTNDNGTGSLRAAIASASSGDDIRFDASLLSNGSNTIRVKSPITIKKGIFIHGLYNNTDTLYFSGRDTNGIFTVSMDFGIAYYHVHFDSMVFVHGNGSSGGAIYIDNNYSNSNGYVYVKNCVFRDNYAYEGGAIGGNRANNNSSVDFKFFLDIYNSDFINNSSTARGGAIGFTTYATGQGYTREAQCVLKAVNSNFMGNYAATSGGAISVYAVVSSTSYHVGKADIKLISCSFAHNQCKADGGAIYCYSTSFSVNSTVAAKSVIDCTTSTFYNNKAVGNGGCFFVYSTSESRLYTRKSTICKNYCLLDGSAAYLKSNATNNVSTSVVRHYSYSSIFLDNYGNPNKNNTQYMTGGYSRMFECYGYNIFDVPKSHFSTFGNYGSNDQFQKTSAEIKLSSLQENSRNTYSLYPDSGSVAINSGGQYDTDSAQNGPIKGIRDIGASESNFCAPKINSIATSICEGSNYSFNGKTINIAGKYSDTIPRANDCDSIVELTLTVNQKSTPNITIHGTYSTNHFLEGSNVTYSATGTNLGTSPTYQWYLNNVKVGSNSENYSNSGFKDEDKIHCIATSSLSCVSKQNDTSDIISLKVQFNNNEPCNPIVLGINQTCKIEIFTNSGSSKTTSVASPSCATSATNDVWFKFKSPASGNVTFQTFSGFMTDAVISIYSGSCNNLVEIGCIDDVVNSKMPDGILENPSPNTDYFVRISRSAQSDGTFGICLTGQTQTNAVQKQSSTDIHVYPNPTDQFVDISSPNEQITTVEILDLTGKTIGIYNPLQFNYTLDLSNLNPNIYLLKIHSLKGVNHRLIEKK